MSKKILGFDSNKKTFRVVAYYGEDNKILDSHTIHLLPKEASELITVIEVLMLGYPALREFEVPENEQSND